MEIEQNLRQLRTRIESAEHRFGRPTGRVILVAVSKGQPVSRLVSAFQGGQARFGESYVQEAVGKMHALAELPIEWHFIGPIQSNKTRTIAEQFDWVHSVDRLKIAQRLSEQRPPEAAPLQVCLQVKLSREPTKFGMPVAQLPELAKQVAALPRLQLRGLMTIPAPSDDFEAQRRSFRTLRLAQEYLNDHGLRLDTLSIGMSDDLEAAIAEGATIVRVGSAIFGARPMKQSAGDS